MAETPATVAATETRKGRTSAVSPHALLGLSVGVVLALEYARGSATLDTSPVWPVAQALVAASALVAVFGARDRLRLVPVLLLGLVFQLGWIAVHLQLGVTGDYDVVDLYPAQGDVLLARDYPESEYPPGAVALFAIETWLGGGSARTANALLMVPFQLVCVVSIWALRTQWAPWLATVLALWPLNVFYWEFRFDLIPTAALVAALALAWRSRWYEAGFVLGLGTVVKWTPALSFVALLLWLLRRRRFDRAGVHLVGFAIPVLLVNLPLLAWRPTEVLHAYTTQGARTVTAESFVYLPLGLFWDVAPGYWYFGAADVPEAANRAAEWGQAIAVLAVLALAALARTRSGAIALAALVPAVFLLTNRIFSPQFYVLVVGVVLLAAGLVARRRFELLAMVGAMAVATTANTVLFQSYLGARPVETFPSWIYLSVLAFAPAIGAVAWLVVRGALQTAAPSSGSGPNEHLERGARGP